MTVPNGPGDIATFGLSNTTNVSISATTEVNGIVFTAAATNPYSITVGNGSTLTLSGTGITNNSGGAQTFDTPDSAQIHFTNGATAGNAKIPLNSFGYPGSVDFFDYSTAGSALIGSDGLFETITFHDNATAGSATIGTGDTGVLNFFDHSSAGTATISCTIRSQFDFSDFSTAGSATIQNFGFNTTIRFLGSSQGGKSAIGLFPFQQISSLDISFHNAPGVTIGSLEGNGIGFASVSLGANNLTVGSNQLSTAFSGVIYDDGFGGSLTKIGKGTLALTGANTYTGVTNINGGVLQVDGSISSNTFINHGGTLAGGGTVYGDVTNYSGQVSPGDPLGVPGVLTVSNNYMQSPSATLTVQIGGADPGQASVLNVLGNANLNGALDPELVNGFVPDVGQSFTILGYASVTGSFSHIQNPVFDRGKKRWSLVYQPTGAALVVVNNGRQDSQRNGVVMARPSF